MKENVLKFIYLVYKYFQIPNIKYNTSKMLFWILFVGVADLL